MMKINKIFLVITFIVIIISFNFSSCSIECGDVFDRSPKQLLNENDYVLLGNFLNIDTLTTLGKVNYLDSESKFFIIEYSFQPNKYFKNIKDIPKIYLWNCERVDKNDKYSTIAKLKRSDIQLIYGNEINQFQEIINVMSSMTSVGDVKDLIENNSPPIPWNTMRADSIIAEKIKHTNSLASLLKDRNSNGQVIYGTDLYLSTFDSFRYGKLCYYDDQGKGHHVEREKYLSILEKLQ